MTTTVYDGKNVILGRLATQVAKAALLGEKIAVVNCQDVVISGSKKNTLEREAQRRRRKGYPLKSAKLPRLPDRVVRRSIRGMLPWKQARGKEAFARVMCYAGVPSEFDSAKKVAVQATVQKLPTLKYTTVGEICKILGGK
jgi:large subunit ribosomal protein L13